MLLKEGHVRIPSGCAISGFINRKGKLISGSEIIKSITVMHDRSNGLGGGFAGYGIYPQYKDLYAFHIFYDNQKAKELTEEFINKHFEIECLNNIETRKHPNIINQPIIMRYFLNPVQTKLKNSELDEREYVARCVVKINSEIDGAYVFSSGKNMGVFKAVGYPEDVGEFYRLEEYQGYSYERIQGITSCSRYWWKIWRFSWRIPCRRHYYSFGAWYG